MRASKAAAVSLALAALLAACMDRGGDDVSTTSTSPGPPLPNSCANYDAPTFVTDAGFSGPNAFAHLLSIVCDFTQDPPIEQPRVPGTAGRIRAAGYLHDALAANGWAASYEKFTGQQYQDLDKGSVSSYATAPSQWCSQPDADRVTTLEFSNVVAEHGAGPSTLILMAHYDSKRFASKETDAADKARPVLGANDGASGVAVLLEAARVLSTEALDQRVRILLVDGEDGFEDCHPLAGSLYHAHNLSQAERDDTDVVLLLDMVGDLDARFCLSHNNVDLAQRLKASATAQNFSAVSDAPDCGVLDDHTAFMELGVAAVDLIDFKRPGFPPYWHTLEDTPDKIDAVMLEKTGRTVVDFVRSFSA